MSWKFNPPPGWPPQPPGWAPTPGWAPDPSWPPPPAGWQFWVPADDQPGPSQPTAVAQPGPSQPGLSPGGPPAARRPWFQHWWTFAVLVAVLLVGAAAGYSSVRASVVGATESGEPGAAPPVDQAEPTGPAQVPGLPDLELPDLGLPSLPPPPGSSEASGVCGRVVLIMLPMFTAILEDFGDADAYQDALIDSRRTAAGAVRAVPTSDPDERAALDALADGLDAAAQLVEDNRDDPAAIAGSFDIVSDAYGVFNAAVC